MASPQHAYTYAAAAPGSDSDEFILSKVPQATIAFWVVKVFATTLG